MITLPLPGIQALEQKTKRAPVSPDVGKLYPQQKEAFFGLREFLQDPDCHIALLSGVAGSGKSTLMAMFTEWALHHYPGKHIAHTATTNKAVRVTINMAEFQHGNLQYSTVHSLLKLKEKIKPDGTIVFEQDYDSKHKPGMEYYNIVIVDEASMLDPELFTGGERTKGLYEYTNRNCKLIFVGDENQIPAVGHDASIVFTPEAQKKYNIRVFELTEIIRQAADSPIITLSKDIRENPHYKGSFKDGLLSGTTDFTNPGVYSLDMVEDKPVISGLMKHLFTSPNFEANPDFAKVLAWRNKTVATINRSIRKFRYGLDARRIEPGEKIIAQSPIVEGDTVLVINNGEMEVVEFTEAQEVVEGNDGVIVIPYYKTKVRVDTLSGSQSEVIIRVVTYEGLEAYEAVLNLMSLHAKAQVKGSYAASAAWKEYFGFARLFADINYNYSLTTHRAQGSTYDNVILMEADILTNRKVSERNRILYTGVTRPRQRLFIV